jgi:hypothetical protein
MKKTNNSFIINEYPVFSSNSASGGKKTLIFKFPHQILPPAKLLVNYAPPRGTERGGGYAHRAIG